MVEYLVVHLWQTWAIVAFICLILEMTSGDFFIFCFAVGSLTAAIVAPFTDFYVQMAVMIIASVCSIFWIRPVALRYFYKEASLPSNADALPGKIGHVSEAIKPGGFGRVKVGGDDWKARAVEANEIPVGTQVKVLCRESVIVTVTTEINN